MRCCPHPEERACAGASAESNARARVSKDDDVRLGSPSCFEMHRSAAEAVGASMLPLRCNAPQHEGERARRILAERTQPVPLGSSPRKRGPMITAGGYGSRLSLRSAGTTIVWSARRPTCGCTKRPLRHFHCFRIVIYNDFCNSDVLAASRAQDYARRRARRRAD